MALRWAAHLSSRISSTSGGRLDWGFEQSLIGGGDAGQGLGMWAPSKR